MNNSSDQCASSLFKEELLNQDLAHTHQESLMSSDPLKIKIKQNSSSHAKNKSSFFRDHKH
jgi:hypothetical protein